MSCLESEYRSLDLFEEGIWGRMHSWWEDAVSLKGVIVSSWMTWSFISFWYWICFCFFSAAQSFFRSNKHEDESYTLSCMSVFSGTFPPTFTLSPALKIVCVCPVSLEEMNTETQSLIAFSLVLLCLLCHAWLTLLLLLEHGMDSSFSSLMMTCSSLLDQTSLMQGFSRIC